MSFESPQIRQLVFRIHCFASRSPSVGEAREREEKETWKKMFVYLFVTFIIIIIVLTVCCFSVIRQEIQFGLMFLEHMQQMPAGRPRASCLCAQEEAVGLSPDGGRRQHPGAGPADTTVSRGGAFHLIKFTLCIVESRVLVVFPFQRTF